jgi:hypothetical protein
MQLLEKSINEVGVIESISVTKEGTIISGHARKATFDKQGKKPKEVHLSDNEYPVIVRDDIEDNTELYYKAQILANTTSKQNIDLDTELIEEISVEYDLDIEELGVDVLEDTETHLEAEEDDLSNNIKNLYRIEIVCKDEEHQQNTYNKLIEQGHECRLLTL